VHYWQLDEGLAADLAIGALRIGRALGKVVKAEGMNLITSAGAIAEQTVPHVHLHVLPRWVDDRVGPIWPPDEKTESAVLNGLADELRSISE
jgi:histidine triad (HIT) family protein